MTDDRPEIELREFERLSDGSGETPAIVKSIAEASFVPSKDNGVLERTELRLEQKLKVNAGSLNLSTLRFGSYVVFPSICLIRRSLCFVTASCCLSSASLRA